MITLGPKTASLGPQFCRILVLGPHFWWSGGARGPPLDPPLLFMQLLKKYVLKLIIFIVNKKIRRIMK